MSIKEPVTRDTVDNKFTNVPRYFIERGRFLTPQAKWVWIVLKTFENNKTKRIFPSHSTIEEWSGLSRAAVNKALKELERFHWIEKQKESGKSTNYKLIYGGYYPNEQLENAVTPIPTKEAAKTYKAEQREKRAQKNGTFARNAKNIKVRKASSKGK